MLDGSVLNVTSVPTASVAAMVNPNKLPPYDGATGSVEGTISIIGEPPAATPDDFSKCPDAEKTWGHAFREGPPVGDKGARALADAIVVAIGYKNFFVPETHEAKEARIEGCAYTSRTVTMTFGQRLDVKNVSKDFWTPLLEPGKNMVLMMAPPNADPAKLYPKKEGHYLLLDRDRKYVVVDVYAFLHPLHASTDLSGHYRIDGLPLGKLTIGATHPRLSATAEKEIVVAAGVHRVDLVLENRNVDAGAPSVDGGTDAARPSVVH